MPHHTFPFGWLMTDPAALIESDIIAGLQVDAYLASGQGTLNKVMTGGFSHGFRRGQANRNLVVWLRQFNAGRHERDQLRFYGFDAPLESRWAASPRPAPLALHDLLALHFSHLPVNRATLERLCRDDARWTNQAAAMDPSQSVGATVDAWHLRALADDLVGFLETQRPELGAHPNLWTAQLHARMAPGLLRYHANLAVPSQGRISQMLALRAVMMTENLLAMAERGKEREPTLVFADNSHLQRGASQIQMETMKAGWSAASLTRRTVRCDGCVQQRRGRGALSRRQGRTGAEPSLLPCHSRTPGEGWRADRS